MGTGGAAGTGTGAGAAGTGAGAGAAGTGAGCSTNTVRGACAGACCTTGTGALIVSGGGAAGAGAGAGIAGASCSAGAGAAWLGMTGVSPGLGRWSTVGRILTASEMTRATTPTTKIEVSALPTSRNGLRLSSS